MNKKRHSTAHGKVIEIFSKKRIDELSEDDYVDPYFNHEMSESDIGIPIHKSNAEGNDESTIRSYARVQEESNNQLREELVGLEIETLQRVAKALHIDFSNLSRDELLEKIIQENDPPIPLAY